MIVVNLIHRGIVIREFETQSLCFAVNQYLKWEKELDNGETLRIMSMS